MEDPLLEIPLCSIDCAIVLVFPSDSLLPCSYKHSTESIQWAMLPLPFTCTAGDESIALGLSTYLLLELAKEKLFNIVTEAQAL